MDPAYMEGKDQPVDFKRVLSHTIANVLIRSESCMTGNQINACVEKTLSLKKFEECSVDYCNQMRDFMKSVAKTVDETHTKYGLDSNKNNLVPKVLFEVNRITESQIVTFLNRCHEKFIKAKIEPGTCVGALGAQVCCIYTFTFV